MPRRPNPVLTYRLHKPSGQAVVTVPTGSGRRDIYLGRFGSEVSRAEYARVVAESKAVPTAPRAAGSWPFAPSVNEVALTFMTHAEGYYRKPDGTPTNEVKEFKGVVRFLRGSHGHAPAAHFGPLALAAVRQAMIDAGWCRTRINRQVEQVKRLFKWAASKELVPAGVPAGLGTLGGLRRGRSEAVESDSVVPVPAEVVARVLPHVTPTVRAMVELQMLTGMRPGEVRDLTPGEVDRSGEVWVYRPGSRRPGGHKMAYADRDRTVYLGPKARAVPAQWLDGRGADDRVFTPRRSKEEWWAMLRAGRRSKVTPCQVFRRKPADQLKEQWRDRWTDDGYAQAVAKACKRAGVAPFAPNRIRHLFATEVRAKYGLEAAQVLLGHATADVTQVYAERDQALALKVAVEAG